MLFSSARRETLAADLRAAGCVFAEEEADLLLAEAADGEALAALLARRTTGEPLEHVLGYATFAGRRICVDRGVFVPRRRSEFLVDVACAAAPERRPLTVVDLCCGSGALGLAIAARLGGFDRARSGQPGVHLHAADMDPTAVACARRNLAAAGGTAYVGELFEPLPGTLRGRVDLLVANVPYVPTADLALLPAEARLHEPRAALDGGPDGLAVLRRFAAGACDWLAPGGRALAETSAAQATAALAAFAAAGLPARAVAAADHDTTVIVSD